MEELELVSLLSLDTDGDTIEGEWVMPPAIDDSISSSKDNF